MQERIHQNPFQKEAAHLLTETEFAEGDVHDALIQMTSAQKNFDFERRTDKRKFIHLNSPEAIQSFYEKNLRTKEAHAATVKKLEELSPALKRDFRLIRAQQMIADLLPFDTSKDFGLLDESGELATLLKKKQLHIGSEPFHVNGIRAFAGAAEIMVRKGELYYPDPTLDALLGIDAIVYDDELKRHLLIQVKSANIPQELPLIIPADEFIEEAIEGRYNTFLHDERKEYAIAVAEKIQHTAQAFGRSYPKQNFSPLMWFMPVGERAKKYFDPRTGLPREDAYDKVTIP